MIFNMQTARLLYYFIHRRTALKLNRYFLMFGGSQVQKSYRASTNDFLNF